MSASGKPNGHKHFCIMYISKNGLLSCLVMMTMFMGFLTSCGDDEDDIIQEDDKGGGFVTKTEAGDFDGTHLTAVGNGGYYTYFRYNSDGSLRLIEDDYEKIVFDYTNGTATFIDGTSEQKAHFTTNQKGYITELSNSGSDEDGNWDVVYKFQYNSSDHLTNVAFNEVYTYLATKETTDVTWKFTWNGDLLSNVEVNGTDNEERWSSNLNFTYTDATDNRYMQYTDEVIGEIDLDGGIEVCMYVGLFGKGPSKYPSKIEGDYDDAYITYDLNSKGLVERENVDYGDKYNYTIEFSYDNLSKDSAPVADNKAGVGRKRHMNNRNNISLWGRKK